MESIGYVASILMGVTLGLMGGGGSILTVPILVYLFTVAPTIATGYSLFVVGATALMGSLMYLRKGEVDLQAGLAFALPSVLGVNISRGVIIPQIPPVVFQVGSFALTKEILIMITFAILMMAASYSMLKKKNERKTFESDRATKKMILIGLQGFIVGIIAGFVGAGGGFLIIPVLVFLASLSMRIAIGTSLGIIAFQSLFGFAGDMWRGIKVDWSLLGAVTIFAMIGIAIGSAFAHKINEQKLKKAFGFFVLIMGLTILIEQARHLSH